MEDAAEKVKQLINEIENDCGWNTYYQEIRIESMKYDYSCGEAKTAANRPLNRYRDVNPYDHSRVILQNGPCDYINASLVKVEQAERNYILTQGALPQTSGHFWLMIWEQKSRGILMLNKIIEKNQIKCHQYWPIGAKNGDSDNMEFHDVNLRVHLISEEETPNFVVRTLVIEEMNTGNKREVLQFHYTTWPDFGVPSTPRAFLHFLQVVRDSDALNSKHGPIVVHCSAGIGRSGTFCLVDSCLLMMEKGLQVDIKELLLEMRKFRIGLIQTADQLRFSYLAILEGCTQLADGNKKFLPDVTNTNGLDTKEADEIPLPPTRTSSVSPTEEQYRRLIELTSHKNIAHTVADRPLPPLPSSSSEGESSSEDLIEFEDDEQTTSTSYGLLDHLKDQNSGRRSSVSDVDNISDDSKRPSGAGSVHDYDDISQLGSKANGGLDENELRRRLKVKMEKQESLREKIKEIRAKQKETEARQHFYRNPKRKKTSN